MFTQCPKCQSVFMVSEKDVKAHEGLVRCGNCYSVFNSSWNLTDDPRNQYVGEHASVAAHPVKSVPQGGASAFTFNILGDSAGETNEAEAHVDDEKQIVSPESFDDTDTSELEPFPEPDMDDFPAPDENKKGEEEPEVQLEKESEKEPESLLYFDANDAEEETIEIEVVEKADDDKPRNDTTPIEDLTLLQTTSLVSDITKTTHSEFAEEFGGEDQLLPEVEVASDADSETETGLLTAESMWPGNEAEFVEHDLEAAADITDDGLADLEGSLPVLMNDDATELPEFDASVPDISPELLPIENIDTDADLKVNNEEELVRQTPTLDSFSDSDGDEASKVDKANIADDTFAAASDEQDADEFFSLDALPKTAEEAFGDTDENVKSIDESVFITSDEEEFDDAYVPISLKVPEQEELFHGLDDFPEPGKLSELNYEDTMEINAMLEEANISKEQIDSALSAAQILDDEESAEAENLLSSDADNDLSESIFSTDIEGNSEDDSESDDRPYNKKKSAIAYLSDFLPLGMGNNKAWKEQNISDDQTQLIRSLSRGNRAQGLPVWVGKYSLIAASVILVVSLLGQIGYFYMDRLVHITPLKPILNAGCSLAGCTVPEIQNTAEIDQLSSRLSPIGGGDGGFQVTSILANRDIRSQAYPALELTLTDRAGNMISRRVVTREEYLSGSKSTLMRPNEAVDISIRFRTPSIRVDGFSLRPVMLNWLE